MSKHAELLAMIERAAHEGDFGDNYRRTPTAAMCEAGNYKKGRLHFAGLPLTIEQPRNSVRRGTDKNGVQWESRMGAHYGDIEGTRGADGDPVDVFIGTWPLADTAYVINQYVDGRFDEHKVMLAFQDEAAARSAYLASYERGWPGLESLTPVSISQLKWWLKHGDMSKPLTARNLPQEGHTMNRIAWNPTTQQPIGQTLDRVLYDVRREDGEEGLLLDSCCAADILADSEGVLVLDAMVVPFARLPRQMELLKTVMERTGGSVKPLGLQITEPFKQRGVANVAAIFELSDGQTLSIYFHNPDVTPAKMAPGDELISWKWLLNKKDVTIVVAPERGKDLNVREVARRTLKLAEKNSAAFARANANRAARMQNIADLKDEVAALETELTAAQHELEVAQQEAVDRQAAKDKAAVEVSIEAVAAAMDKTRNWSAWWSDEAVNATINQAAVQGWVRRPSTSQVEWTDKGIAAYRAWKDAQPTLVDAAKTAVETALSELGASDTGSWATDGQKSSIASTYLGADLTISVDEIGAVLIKCYKSGEDGRETSATSDPVQIAQAIKDLVAPQPDYAGYESRYPERVARIGAAMSAEEADAVVQEEYADNARHAEGTGKVESAARDRKAELVRMAAEQAENAKRDAGEWVFFKGYTPSLSADLTDQEAARLNALNDGFEYRTNPGQHDDWAIFYRKKPAAPAIENSAWKMTLAEWNKIPKDYRGTPGFFPGYDKSALKLVNGATTLVPVEIIADENKPATQQDVLEAIKTVRPFLSKAQLNVMGTATRGEEGQWFKDKFVELAELIKTMPRTYGQDGKGDQAIAYLHYFTASTDHWITELDMEGDGTEQAFGLAKIHETELGYISIAELVAAGAELDLHWTPKTLAEIKGSEGDKGEEPIPFHKMTPEQQRAAMAAEKESVTDEQVDAFLKAWGDLAVQYGSVGYRVAGQAVGGGAFYSVYGGGIEVVTADGSGVSDAGADQVAELRDAIRGGQVQVSVFKRWRDGVDSTVPVQTLHSASGSFKPFEGAFELPSSGDLSNAEGTQPAPGGETIEPQPDQSSGNEFTVGTVKLKAFTQKSASRAVWGVEVVETGKTINAADGSGSWFKNDTKANMIEDLNRMYEATMRGGDPVSNENRWRKSFGLPPVGEANPEPTQPEATDPHAADRAFFQSVIDGTAPDMLAPDLADQLEQAYYRVQGQADLEAMFEQAVNAYTAAAMKATDNMVAA